jgi:hypothetical protein
MALASVTIGWGTVISDRASIFTIATVSGGCRIGRG